MLVCSVTEYSQACRASQNTNSNENTQQYYIPKHQKVIYYLTAFLIPVLFVLFYVQLDDN